MEVVETIYKLRDNFILIGLTGRTGSGCSTVAQVLATKKKDLGKLKSLHYEWNPNGINNDARKNRIVHNYICKHWNAFRIIKASDVIFFYLLLADYKVFYDSFAKSDWKTGKADDKSDVQKIFDDKDFEKDFNELSVKVQECNTILENKDCTKEDVEKIDNILTKEIPQFRNKIDGMLKGTAKEILTPEFQRWGNNIRKYDSIVPKADIDKNAPSCLARKINKIVKAYRVIDKDTLCPTHIVIDALRNPYEVLYFRERYSAFYLMSVNTTEEIRHDALFKKGYKLDEIKALDKEESEKKDFRESYQKIDIDKCIELSDIHITHDATPTDKNRDLVTQIFTYLSLILHPGLVPPSPMERLMQVAFTAKLNSGCLSRQVGAAVTDEHFSVKSIGWNTAAEGQTPCTLRSMDDLIKGEDEKAFSNHERNDKNFQEKMKGLRMEYDRLNPHLIDSLKGLPLTYCFKDIHTSINDKQKGNQVHTRSLHAEENAFLQLAKYGSMGIKGGKLFTTASPCELCAKKAYQLGIKEIYYIDSYPGISQKHILECGENPPKMILFKGAIGRAYINLYNPLLPLKDEIEMLTNVEVKKFLTGKVEDKKQQAVEQEAKQEDKNQEKGNDDGNKGKI